jgi:hypothetical protein
LFRGLDLLGLEYSVEKNPKIFDQLLALGKFSDGISNYFQTLSSYKRKEEHKSKLIMKSWRIE